jgi:hypothetical protein
MVYGMDRRIAFIAVAMAAMAALAPECSLAQGSALIDEIGRSAGEAERLYDAMAAMDQRLAGRQQQVYAGYDTIPEGQLRLEVSAASFRASSWRQALDFLESDYRSLEARAGQLPPGEQAGAREKLGDLRQALDRMRPVMDSIDGRVSGLWARVM